MNKTFITGNIGNDAEIKPINDKDYMAFSIADKGKNDTTIWYNCYYRATDNNQKVMQYLKKGAKVLVEGKLNATAYISKKDNTAKVDLSLWINNLEILAFAKDKQEGEPHNLPLVATPATQAQEGQVDDMPF